MSLPLPNSREFSYAPGNFVSPLGNTISSFLRDKCGPPTAWPRLAHGLPTACPRLAHGPAPPRHGTPRALGTGGQRAAAPVTRLGGNDVKMQHRETI